MTKTYNDIDVVTHLLAERDRDLELAARIGQSLLQRNHLLQERNEVVEEHLAQALDQVHQLQHELSKKDELLRMVASSEDSETDSSISTPVYQQGRPPGGATNSTTLSQLESLQRKLQEIEEENLALRSEACQLKRDTITFEEKEQQLVSDCVKELRESNSQMVSLTDELSQKNEELLRHQEEIAQLLSQIVQLQHRVKELALEKEELRIHLQASKDAQRQLTAELNELTERNAECVEMLHESQEEIKELRSKNTPSAGLRRHLSYGLYPMDSLAAEIEGTMRRELSTDEETTFQDQRLSQRRVFQTVRSVNSLTSSRASSSSPHIPGSGSSLVMTSQPFLSNEEEEVQMGRPGSPGGSDLSRALNRLSLRQQNFLSERQFFQTAREKKLRALEETEDVDGVCSPMNSVLSSFSNLSELSFSSSVFKTFLPEKLQIVKPMEGSLTLHHWQQLAKPHLASILDPHPGVVTKGFRPLEVDPVYRLSDMEEDQEEELVQDEPRGGKEGVQEKGAAEQGKDEEDEDGGITFKVRCTSTPDDRKHSTVHLPVLPISQTVSLPVNEVPSQQQQSIAGHVTLTSTVQNPGKCQSNTCSTYTFTTCRILHPSDITQVTSSSLSSVMTNTPSSMRTGPSTPLTPCRLSLGDSFPLRRPAAPTSSLTKLVLEQGISAQVTTEAAAPRRRGTPRRLCLLPSTPPNSPSSSPTPSPVPTEHRGHTADNFLASRPAELFLQDVYGLNLGRAPHPDLPSPSQETFNPVDRSRADSGVSMGLVERLRRLGFSKILHGSAEGEACRVQRQDSALFVSAGGGSLLDGLRRNQSLPALISARAGKTVSASGPPLHHPPYPTSLDLPPPLWGNLKQRRRQLASDSQVQSCHPNSEDQ
ncbi:trafficking kinesin-binding protein 2 isoform X3 [Cynoglossus semilaevis]|nr:trafficking kinesin-binding protein 2-like isoform X3 [Cynoglossus semilaevis]